MGTGAEQLISNGIELECNVVIAKLLENQYYFSFKNQRQFATIQINTSSQQYRI